ncbi:lactonase family protein [Maribacter hydrothermalis]|uniref:6-phosphogluconolactonase n=1 Tax=Maribacter hydrothermalis TaxID=1836467 RepID=A0A1B7Z3U8_9FLAO|nr:lactonase family protein [Maribacter hydrothermalis]APQ17141.1 6-phosphogluconolactonase [Maribacter hydrothermalis]OBR37402.1 6-phosphogluconolactonase [Maribacter hydrothermalis]
MKNKVGLLIAIIGLVILNSCKMEESKIEEVLFVGTYTDNGSEGIYRYSLNLDTGELTNKSLAAKIKSPSYLAFSPDKNSLYAVSEVDNYKNEDGSITTFRVKDTTLTEVAVQSTHGAHPCFVGVSDDGKLVAVANYTGGNVAVFSALDNGNLKPSPQVIDHKVLDTSRTAHAHMAAFLNDELIVSDLGLDRIKRYKEFDGKFVSSEQKELVVAEGAGPRHFVISKDAEFLYVINELNSTITMFKKDEGKYYGKETYDTVASDFKGESYCADLHLSPDGKYLYGTNRGENTVVIFEVDQITGKLKLVGRESVIGDWPRNFTIDPTGKYLLVANQRSNNIVVFNRDAENGTLSFVSQVDLPSPVCLKFY